MLGIAQFKYARKFNKMYRDLPDNIREDFSEFAASLMNEAVAKGRQLRKMRGKKGIYEARLSAGYRVTFAVTDHTAIFETIGTHDQAYGR